MSGHYKTQYCALWKNGKAAVQQTEDKEAFFNEFDTMIEYFRKIDMPKDQMPTVEVRVLEWTEWTDYGTAQERGWVL